MMIFLFITVTASSCGEQGTGTATWRFAIEETTDSVQDTYAQEFKRRVEERTQGAVEVKVYPYGTLGTSDDITEQLRMGSLQFAMASPGHLGKTIPELQIFLLHFLLPEQEARLRATIADARLRSELNPLFAEKDLRLLSILPEGWMVWTTQEPVREPADFEGVKIRTMTSPLLLAAYEAYGASPQAMPYGEVYGALQLNMIDAQVNPVFAIEEMSFFEVTDCMVFANHAPFLTTLVANDGFLADLDPKQRTIVEEVVRELDPWLFEVQRELNEERLAKIRERKPEMEIVRLTDAERDAFRELSHSVRNEYLQRTGERGAALLEAVVDAAARADAE
jgi:TRAP-type transport system periplasmic protein